MKKSAAKLCVCLLCFFLTDGRAQNVSELLRQGVSARRVVIPLYTGRIPKLSAVVRVDHAYIDYERRGFFHIGLFPIGVLEGVTFEVKDTDSPESSLGSIQRWLGTKAGQRIEMRRLKLIFSPTRRLEAGLGRHQAGDRWELLEGVRFFSAAGEAQAKRAVWEMSAPHGGRIIFDTAPRATNTFFPSSLIARDSFSATISDPHPSK